MKCNNCGTNIENNKNFCPNCGNKIEVNDIQEDNKTINQKKSKSTLKIVIITIIASIALIICLFFVIIGSGIVNLSGIISSKLDDYEETEKIRKETYDSIPEELINKKMISSNWKYVDSDYGWSGEWIDKEDKYYFYIDKENYNLYKKYWLEDIEESEYSPGLNQRLWEYGNHVFHLINVRSLSYNSDIDYGNVHLYKDKTYYLVQIFDKAIYYKYISDYHYKDLNNNYAIFSNFSYDYDSLLKEYIFYQDDNEWIIEELHR